MDNNFLVAAQKVYDVVKEFEGTLTVYNNDHSSENRRAFIDAYEKATEVINNAPIEVKGELEVWSEIDIAMNGLRTSSKSIMKVASFGMTSGTADSMLNTIRTKVSVVLKTLKNMGVSETLNASKAKCEQKSKVVKEVLNEKVVEEVASSSLEEKVEESTTEEVVEDKKTDVPTKIENNEKTNKSKEIMRLIGMILGIVSLAFGVFGLFLTLLTGLSMSPFTIIYAFAPFVLGLVGTILGKKKVFGILGIVLSVLIVLLSFGFLTFKLLLIILSSLMYR